MLKNIGKRTFSEIMDDPTVIAKQPRMQRILLSEDGTLKYDFMFPLQKIVMAKIVGNLWLNQIKENIIDFSKKGDLKDSIVGKISQLFLPNNIKEQLQDIVDDFGEQIYKWVLYNRIFFLENSMYSAKNFISDITWTVRGRIDFVQTAKNILANQDRLLSDDDKYKLACMYCLEDEIAVLAPKVCLNKFYLSDIPIDIHPMVYFWTAHFTGDNTPMINPYYDDDIFDRDEDMFVDMSVNERILLLLINDEHCHYIINDIPIRYIWNKLNEEEKTKYIIPLVKEVHNSDFIFSLLSNIQYDQQQKIFKECPDCVLHGTLDDLWWWGEYFLPTALHAMDIMDPETHWYILQYIYEDKMFYYSKLSKYRYDQLKSFFKQLWRETSMQFKKSIFQLRDGFTVGSFLANEIDFEQDTDIFELIFNDLSPQDKKRMFFEYIDTICSNLIRNDKWDLLEMLLKDVLSSEEDINQLKERLIEVDGSEIAIHFLKTNAYDALKRFINWAFKSKEEVWKLFNRGVTNTDLDE